MPIGEGAADQGPQTRRPPAPRTPKGERLRGGRRPFPPLPSRVFLGRPGPRTRSGRDVGQDPFLGQRAAQGYNSPATEDGKYATRGAFSARPWLLNSGAAPAKLLEPKPMNPSGSTAFASLPFSFFVTRAFLFIRYNWKLEGGFPTKRAGEVRDGTTRTSLICRDAPGSACADRT